MVTRSCGESLRRVLVSDLRPGDYVIPVRATVLGIEWLAYHGLVRFTGRSAQIAMPSEAMVSVYRESVA